MIVNEITYTCDLCGKTCREVYKTGRAKRLMEKLLGWRYINETLVCDKHDVHTVVTIDTWKTKPLRSMRHL